MTSDESADEKIPTSVWSGILTVMGVDLRCHRLDNGKVIIEEDSIVELLKAMSDPDMRSVDQPVKI